MVVKVQVRGIDLPLVRVLDKPGRVRAITNNMVGRVLRKHGIVVKDGASYALVGFDALMPAQVEQLVALCKQRLDGYLEARGERAFAHRDPALGYISGTLRYEVLKRAAFRCELCGVPADIRALEVDHITPRNKGGTDDLINPQALCYSCNSMKRDRDSTDFRAVRASYKHREDECPFCDVRADRIVAENELALAIRDAYPVTELHTLVIPKRHLLDYFAMSLRDARVRSTAARAGAGDQAGGQLDSRVQYRRELGSGRWADGLSRAYAPDPEASGRRAAAEGWGQECDFGARGLLEGLGRF